MRGRRQAARIPILALVGYTNAGKSTLLRRLTGTDTLVADRLFATLDPLVRRLDLPDGGREVLLADTVGFIQDLPHHLVAAFRATLEEVVQAHMLLHVVDVSHPRAADMVDAVNLVLSELGAIEKPTITVLNKVDRLEGIAPPQRLAAALPNPVAVSALTGEGIDRLLTTISRNLGDRRRVAASIPYDRMDLVALAHDQGHVRLLRYDAEGVYIEADVDPAIARRIASAEAPSL